MHSSQSQYGFPVLARTPAEIQFPTETLNYVINSQLQWRRDLQLTPCNLNEMSETFC
jgi:hypothetical protein